MFGTIAGGLMAIGGGLYNAITGKNLNEKREQMINRMSADADNAYYAGRASRRAMLEHALGRSRDAITNGIRNVRDTSGVTGGDSNGTAKMQEQYLNASAQEAAQGAQSVISADAQAEQLRSQQKQNIASQRLALETEKMKNTAEAASGVAKAGAQMAVADISKGLNGKKSGATVGNNGSQMGKASAESVISSAAPDEPAAKSGGVITETDKPDEYYAMDDFFGLKDKKGYV